MTEASTIAQVSDQTQARVTINSAEAERGGGKRAGDNDPIAARERARRPLRHLYPSIAVTIVGPAGVLSRSL